MLLISGWLLVLAALVLLSSVGGRLAFAAAGFAVELLGLGVFFAGTQPRFKPRASHWDGSRS